MSARINLLEIPAEAEEERIAKAPQWASKE